MIVAFPPFDIYRSWFLYSLSSFFSFVLAPFYAAVDCFFWSALGLALSESSGQSAFNDPLLARILARSPDLTRTSCSLFSRSVLAFIHSRSPPLLEFLLANTRGSSVPACGFCSMLPSVFLAEVIVPVDLAYSENCVTFPYSFSFSFFFPLSCLREKRKKKIETVKKERLISSIIRLQSCWSWGLIKNMFFCFFSFSFLGKCFTRKSRVWFDFQNIFGESFGAVKF